MAEGEITRSEEATPMHQPGTHFVVSERDGRYAVSILRPKWGFLWRSTEDLFWSYQVLIPTEEKPLTYGFLVSDPIYTVRSGSVGTSGWDYLLLVASADPNIVRVEVIWRAGHAQDNSETQSIVITEFQEGMFHFFLGFQSYIYDSPVFYDLTVGMDHILSAYDEDGELVCRYDDWDWETAPGPLEEGVHPVEPDWADGLDTTVKGSWSTVFYLRP